MIAEEGLSPTRAQSLPGASVNVRATTLSAPTSQEEARDEIEQRCVPEARRRPREPRRPVSSRIAAVGMSTVAASQAPRRGGRRRADRGSLAVHAADARTRPRRRIDETPTWPAGTKIGDFTYVAGGTRMRRFAHGLDGADRRRPRRLPPPRPPAARGRRLHRRRRGGRRDLGARRVRRAPPGARPPRRRPARHGRLRGRRAARRRGGASGRDPDLEPRGGRVRRGGSSAAPRAGSSTRTISPGRRSRRWRPARHGRRTVVVLAGVVVTAAAASLALVGPSYDEIDSGEQTESWRFTCSGSSTGLIA